MAFNLQTYKNNINSNCELPRPILEEWEDWTWKHTSAHKCLLYLKTMPCCVIICAVCFWESWWILFTLEESEMPGSPLLKLTGPFGSNHQMCHGKTATSWCRGRQDFASVNIFPSKLAVAVILTRLTCSSSSLQISLQIVCLEVCKAVSQWGITDSLSPSLSDTHSTYTIQSATWSTNRDKREEEFYQCHLLQIGSSGN